MNTSNYIGLTAVLAVLFTPINAKSQDWPTIDDHEAFQIELNKWHSLQDGRLRPIGDYLRHYDEECNPSSVYPARAVHTSNWFGSAAYRWTLFLNADDTPNCALLTSPAKGILTKFDYHLLLSMLARYGWSEEDHIEHRAMAAMEMYGPDGLPVVSDLSREVAECQLARRERNEKGRSAEFVACLSGVKTSARETTGAARALDCTSSPHLIGIFGEDDRLPVNTAEYGRDPYVSIAYLDRVDGTGTAFWVAPNSLITAAHLAHDPQFPDIDVYLATAKYYGDEPFGETISIQSFYTPEWAAAANDGMINQQDTQHDYAVLKTPAPHSPNFIPGAYGSVFVPYSFSTHFTEIPNGTSVATVGYPQCVQLFGFPNIPLEEQFAGGGEIRSQSQSTYGVDIDISPGNSGGPVLVGDFHDQATPLNVCGGRAYCAIGLVSNSTGLSNWSPKFSGDRQTNLELWIESQIVSILFGHTPRNNETYDLTEITEWEASVTPQRVGLFNKGTDFSEYIVWKSDLDGVLGTGPRITPTVSVGTHVISVSVDADIDGEGYYGLATALVHITGPVGEFTNTDDSCIVELPETRCGITLDWTTMDLYPNDRPRVVDSKTGAEVAAGEQGPAQTGLLSGPQVEFVLYNNAEQFELDRHVVDILVPQGTLELSTNGECVLDYHVDDSVLPCDAELSISQIHADDGFVHYQDPTGTWNKWQLNQDFGPPTIDSDGVSHYTRTLTFDEPGSWVFELRQRSTRLSSLLDANNAVGAVQVVTYADEYEYDDAQEFHPVDHEDGTVQRHTFHDAGDTDWVFWAAVLPSSTPLMKVAVSDLGNNEANVQLYHVYESTADGSKLYSSTGPAATSAGGLRSVHVSGIKHPPVNQHFPKGFAARVEHPTGATCPKPAGGDCSSHDYLIEFTAFSDQFQGMPVESFEKEDEDEDHWEISSSGVQLVLQGNTWKAIETNYQVTNESILRFHFRHKSGEAADFNGIGLVNSLTADMTPNTFVRIAGEEGFGIRFDHRRDVSSWQYYEVPIGRLIPHGDYRYLVMANDADGGQEGEVRFKNVSLVQGVTVNSGLNSVGTGMWANENDSGKDLLLHRVPNTSTYVVGIMAYDEMGRPIHYASAPATFNSGVFGPTTLYLTERIGNTNTPQAVGSVKLEFSSTSKAHFIWSLNGKAGSEPVKRNRALPLGSGTWAPNSPDSPWSFTLLYDPNAGPPHSTNQVLYFFAFEGVQRWFRAQYHGDYPISTTYFLLGENYGTPNYCFACDGVYPSAPSWRNGGDLYLSIPDGITGTTGTASGAYFFEGGGGVAFLPTSVSKFNLKSGVAEKH